MALTDHLELHVYSKNDPNKHLEVLNGRVEPQVMEELRGNGGGSFKISLTDPKVLADPTLLDYRNFYRFKVGDRVIGSFIGKKKKTEVVGPDAANELYVISGAGPRTWLEDGIVFPQGGLKATSATSRSFNFSSQIGNWYVPTDWKNVSNVAGLYSKDTAWTETRPQNFPRIPGAKWIWGDVGAGYVMPKGKNFFRGTFTAPTQGDYTLYLAGDDRFTIYIDGEKIAGTSATSDGFMSAYQTTLELRAGEHVIGVEVENLGGFGGMVAAMYKGSSPEEDDNPDSNSEYLKSLLWATGRDNAMWKVLPYPAKTPGWTPGEVMLTLMDEAKARGVKTIGWYAPSFTATHDTRGVPWQTMEDWTFGVGNTLLQVLERMEELFVDGWVHNDTLAFNLAEARGNDRSGYGFSTSTIVTNAFRNPEGMHSWQTGAGVGPSGFRVFSSTGDISVVSWDRTNWNSRRNARITRKAGLMRIGFEAPWATAGRSVATRFRVRSSVATTVNVYAEPNATTGTTGRLLLASNVSIPAATSVDLKYTFTSPAAAPNESWDSYIVVEATTGTAGTTFDIGDPVVVLDSTDTTMPFWSGSTPNNGLRTYSWAGAENNSESRMATGVVNRGALVFEKGKNLQSAVIDGVGDIKNHLIVRTEESWFEKAGGSIEDYGRVESMLNTSLNVELSKKVADEVFRQKSTPEEAATYTLVESEGHVPFVDFFLGDWVLAPDSTNKLVRRRVVSLSAEETDAGGILHGVEFDTVYQDFDARVRRFMEREGGSLGGSFANATSGSRNSLGNPEIITNPVPSKAFPMPPATMGGTSTAAWDAEGLQAYAKVDLYWAGVTTNVDGGLTSPSFYEVEVTRSGREEWISAGTTGALALTIDRLAVGQSYDFRVRAFNSSEEASGYSPTFSLLTAFPNVPMSAPDKPTLSSQLGLIVVNWNGLLGGAMPPPQFRYVFIEVSTDQVTWTRVGGTFNRDARTLTVANNFAIGSTQYIRLTAVDGVDLKTAASASTSVVIKGVGEIALDQAVAEKINKAATDAAAAVKDFDDLDAALAALPGTTVGGKIIDINARLDENIDYAAALNARGENLITNGSAELGDKTNWLSATSLNVVPSIAPPGFPGAFQTNNLIASTYFADDLIPVNPSQTYRMQAKFLGKTGMRHYLAVAPYDIESLAIATYHVYRVGGETTLAAALNPGDTTITLTDASSWPAATTSNHYLAWWPYVNGLGMTFNAADGYSRNVYRLGSASGSRAGNVVTLPAAYTGPALPAGKVVTLHSAGGSYIYPYYAVSTEDNPLYEGRVSGVGYGALNGNQRFWPGTAKVKVGVLLNNGSLVSDKSGFTGLRFENSSALAAAALAQTTANGRNRVFTSTANASGTADASGVPYINGDIWWKKTSLTAAGQVNGQWTFNNGAWVATEFSQETIASINFDKGIFGTLDGIYLRAGTISTKSLLVSDFTNLLDNPDPATVGGWQTSSGVPLAATFYNTTDRELSFTSARLDAWNANLIPVRPGDKFFIAADVRSIGTLAGVNGGFRVRNQSGTEVGTLNIDPTSTKTRYTWVFTVPATGTTHIRFRYATSLTSGEIRVGNITMRRMEQGELIVDGTIASKHLQADSITTRELQVGVNENIIPNGAGEQKSIGGWMRASNVTFNTTDVPAGATLPGSFQFPGSRTTVTAGASLVPVEPGGEYYTEVWLKASSADSAFILELRNQSGGHAGTWKNQDNGANSSWMVYVTNVPLTWTKFTFVGTMNDTTSEVRVAGVYLNHSSNTATTAVINLAGMRMRRRYGSTLISDGAITTTKIFAGAVVSDSLASRAVTAEKMLIADFTNHIENSAFEGSPTTLTIDPNTSMPGWYIDSGSGFTSGPVTVQNTSGLPGKVLVFSGLAEAGVWNTRYFEVESVKDPHTGEVTMPQFHIQARARVDRANGVEVSINWYDQNKAPLSVSTLTIPITSGTTWVTAGGSTGGSGIGEVPAGARFGRVYVYSPDVTTDAMTWVGQIVVRRKSGGELIVDGGITADHILAKAIRAAHISFDAIEGTHIKAGEIQVGHLSPLVGKTISLTGNLSIQTYMDEASKETVAVGDRLTVHQQQFDFDGEALKISSPASVYSMWLTNERLSIRQNNTDLAWWSADEMYVKKFIGQVVQLAQHQLEDHSSGSGTVVRAL